MFNTKLKKRISFLEKYTEIISKRADALSKNQREMMDLIKKLEARVS